MLNRILRRVYFAYDAAGNATTFAGTTHSYNSTNELTGTGISYDANGNLTGSGTTTYSYDANNRMTQWNSAFTAGYSIGGQRVWTGSTSSPSRYYLYDGSMPVVELGSSGTVSAVNTFGANGLISRNTTGSSSGSVFYTFDEHGNVAQRLSASGAVLSSDLYSAYGSLLSGGGSGDPFGYGGKYGYYTDSATGLVLCGMRYYDPGTGRWISRDPAGFGGGLNLYRYCMGNAVTGVDPSGLTDTDTFGTVISNNPSATQSPPPADSGQGGGGGDGGGDGSAVSNPPVSPTGGSDLTGAGLGGGPSGTTLIQFGGPSTPSTGGGDNSGPVAPSPTDPGVVSITIPSSRYPQAAQHIDDAQAAGYPCVVQWNPGGASAQRSANLAGIPTMPGLDRDEYPPASTLYPGLGSIRHIPLGDNRGAGACYGLQTRGLPPGTWINIKTE